MVTAGVEDGLHIERHIGGVLTAVAVTARVVALLCAVISVVTGLQGKQYAHVPAAVVAYGAVCLWSLVYLALARGGLPALWASGADVGLLTAAMIALRFAGQPDYFDNVANSDLEPAVSAALVGVAIHASKRWTLAACAILGAVHLATVVTSVSVAAVANAVGDGAWQVGIALVCLVGAVRLHRAAAAVEAGARAVLAEREALAEHRGRDLERRQQRAAGRRRQLELHDGPLALLTAMSRPAPVGHPDPQVRARCAANADLLRGLLTDADDDVGADDVDACDADDGDGNNDGHAGGGRGGDCDGGRDRDRGGDCGGGRDGDRDVGRGGGVAGGTPVPGLRLALVAAGADCAALGLRVRYQFGALPDRLPEPVVGALTGATRAALNNVLVHARTRCAWVTVEAVPGTRDAVTVDIVDRGVGFDPGRTSSGLGLNTAIADRMTAVGGTARADSAPAEGTWIRLRWPA